MPGDSYPAFVSITLLNIIQPLFYKSTTIIPLLRNIKSLWLECFYRDFGFSINPWWIRTNMPGNLHTGGAIMQGLWTGDWGIPWCSEDRLYLHSLHCSLYSRDQDELLGFASLASAARLIPEILTPIAIDLWPKYPRQSLL
jgi:hypothetical protein